MTKFLSTLHRWVGIPVGLLFLLSFGTGCLTALDEILKRQTAPTQDITFTYQSVTLADHAAALQNISNRQPAIRYIGLPTVETPYYEVVGRGERTLYSIGDLTPVTIKEEEHEGFFDTVLQLHRNLMLGREGVWGIEGNAIVAWTGLLAFGLSLIGLWIWWPLRKTFNVKDLLPRGRQRKHLYYSHMTAGVILLLPIVLLALTGAAITYRQIAQQVLVGHPEATQVMQPSKLAPQWQAWLKAAYASMPADSQLVRVQFPRQERGMNARGGNENILEFRFITPSDWLGMAASKVRIDRAESTLVEASVFGDFHLGEKLFSILTPLHTGRLLPTPYAAALLVLSFIGTVMVASGLISFVTKKRKRARPRRATPAKSTVPVVD